MAEVKAINGGEVRLCKTCGKEFYPTAQQIKRGGGIYCSIKCSAKSRERKGQVKKAEYVCKNCGRHFLDYPNHNRTFCNSTCQGEWYAKNKSGRNSPSWRGGKTVRRICEVCGSEFLVYPIEVKNGNGRFCSQACWFEYKKTHPYKITLSKEGRESLRICGKINSMDRVYPMVDTKPERIFIGFYQELCIGERVEDTRKQTFFLGRVNPDFIIRDMHLAIFVNGDYWHSPLLRPTLGETQRVDFQIAECKKHKWKALIIWESDLLRGDAKQFVTLALKKEGVLLEKLEKQDENIK